MIELKHVKGKEGEKRIDASTRKQTHLKTLKQNLKKTYTRTTRTHTRWQKSKTRAQNPENGI